RRKPFVWRSPGFSAPGERVGALGGGRRVGSGALNLRLGIVRRPLTFDMTQTLRQRARWACAIWWCVGACSTVEPRPPKTTAAVSARAPKPARWISGARFTMLPDAAEDGSAGSDADGSLRFLVGGLRVLQGADGSLRAADTWLPVGGAPKSLELPARLGGGFVFFAERSEATSLWHAPTWTGTLEPLANLD